MRTEGKSGLPLPLVLPLMIGHGCKRIVCNRVLCVALVMFSFYATNVRRALLHVHTW